METGGGLGGECSEGLNRMRGFWDALVAHLWRLGWRAIGGGVGSRPLPFLGLGE